MVGGGCTGNEDLQCIPYFAEPCKGIDSNYPGDEYCLAKPDPELGMQLHVGPSDYSDPVDVANYLIQPGEETNWAEIQQTENDETIYQSGYYSYMRPGSHHFILYGLNEQVQSGRQDTGGGAESAVGALNGVFLAGATRAIQNAVLISDEPEDQGIGTEMPPHRSVAINLHFINTQSEPLIQELWVNFKSIAKEEVKHWAKPITWYGGLGMNIPPQTHTTLTNRGTECTAPDNLQQCKPTLISVIRLHVARDTHNSHTRLTSKQTYSATVALQIIIL
jgi:hypothetical protein